MYKRLYSLTILLALNCVGAYNLFAQDTLPECFRLDTLSVMPLETQEDLDAYFKLYSIRFEKDLHFSIEELERLYTACINLELRDKAHTVAGDILLEYNEKDRTNPTQLKWADMLLLDIENVSLVQRSKLYNIIGNAKCNIGIGSAGIEYYLKAYNTVHPDSVRDIIYAIGNLGMAYLENGDNAKAKSCINTAIVNRDRLKDTIEILYNATYDYCLLCDIYTTENKTDSAEQACLKAYEAFYKINKIGSNRKYVLNQIIREVTIKKDLNQKNYTEASLQIDTLSITNPEIGALYKAKLYKHKNELQKAFEVLRKKDIDWTSRSQEHTDLLVEIASSLGEYEIAFETLNKQYKILKDRSNEAKVSLTELSSSLMQSYQNERIQDEKRFNQQIQVIQLRQRLWIGAFGILASLVFSIWSYKRYLFSNTRTKKLSKLVYTHEENLEKKNKELNQKIAAMEQFNQLLSHDLREPVRSIVGFTDLLNREIKRQNLLLHNFSYLQAGVSQLNHLLNGIENIRKIEDREKQLRSLKIVDTVHEVINTIKAKQPTFDVNIHNQLDNLSISCDPYFLSIALGEVIQNAVKFCKEDTPKINIDINQLNEKVHITISDNGIGIDPTYSDLIFKVFKRLNRREDYPGGGLGLSLARLALEKIGGSISLGPTPPLGYGSTFCIEIPYLLDLSSIAEKKLLKAAY